MRRKSKKLEEALTVIRANLYYVVQSREAGSTLWNEWKSIPPVKGQDAAYDVVRRCREEYPDFQWRVLKKDEADLYMQGIRAGRRYARQQMHHYA